MLRACSWFGLVVNIERMTQSSSATVPRCGSSSLISMPALSVFREAELASASGPPSCARCAGRPSPDAARIFHQRRLRIPQVHLRRPARHEQQDDVLGLGREVRSDRVRAGARRHRRPADRQGPACRSRRTCTSALRAVRICLWPKDHLVGREQRLRIARDVGGSQVRHAERQLVRGRISRKHLAIERMDLRPRA